MKRKKSFTLIIDIFLALLMIVVAIALTMRVFGFYALPHALKIIVVGYLSLVLGLACFRFVRPNLLRRWGHNRQILFAGIVAGLVAVLFFVLVDYHIVPIRTLHTLTIQNTSETSEVSVWELVLPEGESLGLAETFDQYQYTDGRLLIPPGESITYSRDMVGGVTVKVGAMDWPAQARVVWDDFSYDLAWVEDGNAKALNLPGWSWGTPLWSYRILGFLNIAVDILSVLGLTVVATLQLFPLPQNEAKEKMEDRLNRELLFSTGVILKNLVIVVIAIFYVMFFDENLIFLMLLFAVGVLLYLYDLAHTKPDWVVRIVIVILVAGIAANGYFWIKPPHEFHRTIEYRPDNSFADFSKNVGASNSKYLSIGFYEYLRESAVVISEPIYNELRLEVGMFSSLNRFKDFTFQDYSYQLSDSQVDFLLSLGDWMTWPTRIGDGNLYLLPEISTPGDTYYFFSHGQNYFLISLDFIENSGVMNVLLAD